MDVRGRDLVLPVFANSPMTSTEIRERCASLYPIVERVKLSGSDTA